MLSYIGIGAAVGAVSLFIGATATPDSPPSLSAIDQQVTSSTTAPAAPLATTTEGSPSPFATDDDGFVGTAARCDAADYAVAFGRTERSIVAICLAPDGTYSYHGTRLSDDASLTADVEAQADGEFVARVDGITYVVSSQMFYLMSGSELLREEPWLEYHEPQLAAESSPPPSTPPPSTPAPETFEPVG
ncbi:MAG: hypothetical protein ACSLE6_20700 [Mycobacterium sp.]